METTSRNVFPADNTYRGLIYISIYLFIFRTAPPLSKYKVNNKTVKILFSVRSTQEAKPTMTFNIMWAGFRAFSPLGEKTTIIFVHWRERQGIHPTRSFQVFFFDVSSLKSKGLMRIPTPVNTEDETHLGLQHARGGINPVMIPLVLLGLHGG